MPSSPSPPPSSSKGYGLKVDEKKMKRMISNRESARRSRMKKEQHMKDLNDQIFYFAKKRDEMMAKIERFAKANADLEMENRVLRTQKDELERRLEYANGIVFGWCEGDGVQECGNVEEPWRMIRPWEQKEPSNSMNIVMTSSGFGKF